MVSYDREQVNEMIRRRKGKASLRSFAKEIGVSVAYLSDVLLGRREIGPKVLDVFNLQRIKTTTVRYVRNGK